MEQGNIYQLAINQGAVWNNGNNARPVKSFICPSDPTVPSGYVNADGWAAASYAPVTTLFGSNTAAMNGQSANSCQYTIGNIPDGTSNQVGVVERFANFPAYSGWYNDVIYPAGASWWGSQQGTAYGPWGLQNLPQTNAKPNGSTPAHPYYPNSAHAALQALLLDGSVRGVTSSISAATWSNVCTPNDGNVLGSNWTQ